MGSDQTIGIANKGASIQFTHIPTGHSTAFKAMITNFSDQFVSDWNSQTTYGRMDPIQTFKRTGRVLSFDFDVPSASMEEAAENLRRLSALIQFLYPTYDSDRGGATRIKGSPLMKIKFFNWIQGMANREGLHGTLDGITFNPNMEFGVYELIRGGQQKIVPKVMTVQCRFTVIHDHQLGWRGKRQRGGKNGFRNFPYELYPHYNNLKQDEPNNQSSPRGAAKNPNVKKAREEFMGPPAPNTPLADLENTGRQPVQSLYEPGHSTQEAQDAELAAHAASIPKDGLFSESEQRANQAENIHRATFVTPTRKSRLQRQDRDRREPTSNFVGDPDPWDSNAKSERTTLNPGSSGIWTW